MKKAVQISTFFSLLAAFFFAVRPVSAAVRCETIYGGGETCVRTGQLQIDKEVWHPQEKKFVDNLGITSYKFTLGEEIIFRLKIKNVGDAKFDKVSVSDTLPSYLELVSGSLSFEISDLTPGETEEREIRAKVVSSEKFPSDKILVCVVNTAETWSGDERDKDTSQVCLERKVLGAVVLPQAGPQNWLIVLITSLLAGTIGICLKKFYKI